MVAAVGFTREGGREGTHPGALHGILQGTHPAVLGVYLVCSLTYLVYLSCYEAFLYTALGKYQGNVWYLVP